MIELEKYRVFGVPDKVYYIPDFITALDEEQLIHQIKRTPGPRWTQLSKRRLQNWGGVPHPKGMIAETIPAWLQTYVNRVNHLQIFGEKSANHILLNEYTSGQGIMPHLDGDLFYPTISTISLGSHAVLNFYTKESGEEQEIVDFVDRLECSLYVEPRSLLILQDTMYTSLLHGIQETAKDSRGDFPNVSEGRDLELTRGTRYSLTIRHVPKTSKMKIKFGK